jgi:biopolymer transport protein ExbD
MAVGGEAGGVKSDINVTPLVDVMLVLLIIMMIVAPMLQKGVDVRLPVAANRADKPETQDETVVAIKADKTVYVNAVQVPAMSALRQTVEQALEAKSQRIIFIKADTEAPYATVMETMDELRAAGIEDMALIADSKKGAQ